MTIDKRQGEAKKPGQGGAPVIGKAGGSANPTGQNPNSGKKGK